MTTSTTGEPLLLELLEGFMATQVLITAHRLDVFGLGCQRQAFTGLGGIPHDRPLVQRVRRAVHDPEEEHRPPPSHAAVRPTALERCAQTHLGVGFARKVAALCRAAASPVSR